MMRTWLSIGLGMLVSVGLGACGPGSEEASSPAPAPRAAAPAAPKAMDAQAAAAEAQQIFETRCFTCHGKEGAGDGPGSGALTPPPRNFQDPEWQASVTDEHIAQIIKFGGAAVAKSPAMPGNPDLTSKPEVVSALVQKVRSLKR